MSKVNFLTKLSLMDKPAAQIKGDGAITEQTHRLGGDRCVALRCTLCVVRTTLTVIIRREVIA